MQLHKSCSRWLLRCYQIVQKKKKAYPQDLYSGTYIWLASLLQYTPNGIFFSAGFIIHPAKIVSQIALKSNRTPHLSKMHDLKYHLCLQLIQRKESYASKCNTSGACYFRHYFRSLTLCRSENEFSPESAFNKVLITNIIPTQREWSPNTFQRTAQPNFSHCSPTFLGGNLWLAFYINYVKSGVIELRMFSEYRPRLW